MRITILTVGSRGDVQPFLALGAALKDAGHYILFATHIAFENTIRDLGLEFFPLEGDIREIVRSKPARDVLTAGGNPLAFTRRFIRASEPLVMETVKGMLAACKNTDTVILAGLGFYGGFDVAEKLGVPSVTATLQPLQPTSIFHSPFFPAPPKFLPFKGIYNRFSHLFFASFFWQLVRPLLNKARKEILGLPPASRKPVFKQIDKQKILSLCGISPTVVSEPRDWHEWHKVTGYWFLDAPSKWQPPDDMVDFLNAGEPPVYIGFGSMNDEDAKNLTDIAIQALKMAKRRGILLTGWGAIAPMNKLDDIYITNSIPHGWLFPKMAAVVHHGGAGTTAAGFRAGVPTVIIPFAADQFFWADRVVKLGVGTTLGSRKKLTVEKLSQAIQTVLADEKIRSRAEQLGKSIRQEDGLKDAVKEIEKYFGQI